MDAMTDGRLAGRRVLVTGATGFLGSHALGAFHREGAVVHAVRTRADRQPRVPVPPVTWHEANLADGPPAQAMAAAAPHVVVHLAAYGASSAERDPERIFRVNVQGLWHLLQVIPAGARLVMAGTCAEYGHVRGAAHESMACHPASSYPAAKHAAVTLATAHARETGRPVVVLRPYGPFGPGDDPHRVLPAAIAGLIRGDEVALGDGGQIRDFSYVDDHVEAFVCAAVAEGLAPGAIFNIGTGNGVTVRDALERAAAIVGGPGRLAFGRKPARPDDLRELVPDVSAARQQLGFEARVPFDEGIRRTAASIRRALAGEGAS